MFLTFFRDTLAEPISWRVSCQPHRGISAENRLLRPCQQDQPVRLYFLEAM
jgi:hypothetical protein